MRYDVEDIRDSGFYSSSKWIKTRDNIRERDKFTCQKCGSFTAKRYEVDHIIELTWDNVDDWNIAYNPDNLQLLCHDCHGRKTKQYKHDQERLFF